MKPKRILVSGYYGFSNVGDEAILLSMHQALCNAIPNIEVTVLSAKPEETRREHGLKAISRLDAMAIWRELRRSDLLISGGGSLFQDLTSSRSLWLYLCVVLLAVLAGCPVMVYAQGIGPLRGRMNRMLVAALLRKTALITVRDQESLDELKRLNVVNVPAHLTADPVMALQPPEEPAAAGDITTRSLSHTPAPGGNRIVEAEASATTDGTLHCPLSIVHCQSLSSPYIGVSIRPWQDADRLLVHLSSVLQRLIREKDARILLIPMHYPGDDQITQELYELLDSPDTVSIMPKGYRVEQIIAQIANLDLLIGVRLHALVFAAIASTPAIAICYDPKVDQFARRMEQKCAGLLADVTADILWQAVCQQLQNKEQIRERTRQLSEELRREAGKTAELAAELLLGARG